MTATALIRLGLGLSLAGLVWMLWPVQDADRGFRPKPFRPAFEREWPMVAIDEGHHNIHTAAGRYAPFAALLSADGFRVVRAEGRLTPEALRGTAVFVTANPLGFRGGLQHAANLARLERVVQFDVDAFETGEIETLARWVAQGGRALIAADHAPAGAAARRLARAFGVEMTGWWAEDPRHHDDVTRSLGALVFSRANGLLADHAITNGRDAEEQVNLVMTFTGQALRPPPEGEVLLRLSETAREYPYRASREREGRSAAGLAQAVAVRHGRGRVVVMGEAGALTAQMVDAPGTAPLAMGINRAGVDNAQFVLNVMRWLMGTLD